MNCVKCGKLAEASDRYCSNCGVTLDEKERLEAIGEVILSELAEQGQRLIQDKELTVTLEIDVSEKNEERVRMEVLSFLIVTSEILFGKSPKMATVFAGTERKFLSVMETRLSDASNLFRARKKQYFAAMEEKRGPNELWPLANYFLDNLAGRKTEDFFAMTVVLTYIAGLTKFWEMMVTEIK